MDEIANAIRDLANAIRDLALPFWCIFVAIGWAAIFKR